jgi:diguanylate cyclase (GGDEF)-like protein/PAS domain S-box-containing protein
VLHYEGFMTDVTERKMAEALQERYRAVTDSASDAIISSDSAGHIVGWNLAAETIFGYCASEVMGQPLTVIMPAAAQQGHLAGVARVRAAGEPRLVGRTVESEGQHKDGRRFPVEFSISDWKVADEQFFTAVLRDITERKQAQDELRRAKDALEASNLELQESLAREEILARTDGLTGLCNRSHFEELAAREFRSAVRYERALAIIMIDVDNLKEINDTLGHAAGDEVLALIGRMAVAHTRAADIIARLGGDEFILLLPETTAEQALPIANRLVASVATTPGPNAGPARCVTLSAGIAELQRKPIDTSVELVVQRADKALYRAKAAGRNQARLFASAAEDGSAPDEGQNAE